MPGTDGERGTEGAASFSLDAPLLPKNDAMEACLSPPSHASLPNARLRLVPCWVAWRAGGALGALAA